jgi:hypothetical protein
VTERRAGRRARATSSFDEVDSLQPGPTSPGASTPSSDGVEPGPVATAQNETNPRAGSNANSCAINEADRRPRQRGAWAEQQVRLLRRGPQPVWRDGKTVSNAACGDRGPRVRAGIVADIRTYVEVTGGP